MMKRAPSLSLLALVALLACERGSRAPLYSCASEDTTCTRNQYMVVFRDSVADPMSVIDDLAKKHNFSALQTWNTGMKGFTATLSRDIVDDLRSSPRVAYVREGASADLQ